MCRQNQSLKRREDTIDMAKSFETARNEGGAFGAPIKRQRRIDPMTGLI